MKLKWPTILAALMLSAVLLAPAQATTILSFSDNNVDYTMTMSGTTDTLAITATVTGISFSGASPNTCPTGNCSATFTLNASSSTVVSQSPGGPPTFDQQGGYSGSFSLSNLYDTNTSFVYYAGTVVSANFTAGNFSGIDGGSGASFVVSDLSNCGSPLPGTCNALNITAAAYWLLLTPPSANSQSFAINMTSYATTGDGGLSVDPVTHLYKTGTASGGGTLSSTLYTPEPSTMLLLGGALIGIGAIGRKRRKSL